MRIWKLPDQVVRLALLFLIAIVAMVVVRQRFVPRSFGETGHYRAEAPGVVAAQPIQYAGWQVCAECHTEEAEVRNASYHRTLSCEICHGPAAAHAEDPGEHQPVVPRERGACLFCHSYLPSRSTGFPQVIELMHNPMKACVSCHDPHDPTPPDVPSTCSACHAQIARSKAISHHNSVDCQTCHETPPEHMQNPRGYLPKKPATREFCGQCHAKGAASSREIPRVDLGSHGGTYTCWQCHYPHFPEGR